MELNFEKNGTRWVALFDATSDFNLHIEKGDGFLFIYQRTTDSGQYDSIKDARFNNVDKIIDIDFTAIVYPKHIKVECASLPEIAVITFAE